MSKILKSIMLIGASFAAGVFANAEDDDNVVIETPRSQTSIPFSEESPANINSSIAVVAASTPRANPKDDDSVMIGTPSATPPSTPRGQVLPAAHPDFTNNGALAQYMQKVTAGVFSGQ